MKNMMGTNLNNIYHREHRESIMIYKQNTEHRAITKKVKQKISVNSCSILFSLSSLWLNRSFNDKYISDKKGFTLVEIIVSLVLIGILACGDFGSFILASAQTSDANPSLKSEFIAPGIEHIQITRGYKSEKEATGPWFINMLRIDLTKAARDNPPHVIFTTSPSALPKQCPSRQSKIRGLSRRITGQ